MTHGESSYFRVDKILKISVVDIRSKNDNSSELKIVYELDNSHNNYTLVSGEKIVSEKGAKLLIEATSHSKFNLMQRILYMSDSCEVLEPKEFRALVVKKLKLMKESYGIE